MTDADLYGLGNVRSREQYSQFSAVDLDQRSTIEICDDIISDKLKLVPLNNEPVIKEKGYTVDPHPSLLK